MPDSQPIEAEPALQLRFIFARFAAMVALALAVLNFSELYDYLPDRQELGRRVVPLRVEPVSLNAGDFGPLRLAGAWRLRAADPRFGGASALALDGDGGLIALSDSGVLFRFPKPGAKEPHVAIDELPSGPRNPRFKKNRDSESLMRDWQERGWWVGFENRNQLWLYDSELANALAAFRIGRRWPRTGFEAMAKLGPDLLLFPESRGKALVVPIGGGKVRWARLPAGPTSDAATLPDGTLLLVERKLTPLGISNTLVQVRRAGNSFSVEKRIPLGVRRRDNVEGLAVEQRANGALRLWLITDDDLEWPLRTLLVALDWPAPEAAGESG